MTDADLINLVPRDDDATEDRARAEASALIRRGAKQVTICRSPIIYGRIIVGYRFFALEPRTLRLCGGTGRGEVIDVVTA